MCAPDQEWNILTYRSADPHSDAPLCRARDVIVLKRVELLGLVLPMCPHYSVDAHQRRFRVADKPVVDDIRVVSDRFHIIQSWAAISPDF